MIRIKPTRKPRPPSPSERVLHMAVAAYLRLALQPPVYWTSVDAGAGLLSKAAAGNAKGRGVKSGFPDIIVFMPADFHRHLVMSENHPGQPKNPFEWGPLEPCASLVLGVELKVGRNGLSPVQRDTHAALDLANVRLRVCRSVEEVEAFLAEHGVPLRARSLPLGRAA